MPPGVPRLFLASAIATDLVLGTLLLQFSWERSWFEFSSVDGSIWYRDFSPYATFFPALLIVTLGGVTAATLAFRMALPRWTSREVAKTAAWSHLAIGLGMLSVIMPVYSFHYICIYGRGAIPCSSLTRPL